MVDNYNMLSLLVFKYSKDGQLSDLTDLLKDYSKSKRKVLAERYFDDQWSLFVATLNGHVDIVDYLCSECDVDINKSGSFKLQQQPLQQQSSAASDVTIHFVTSFWVACVKSHLDVVKLLHEKYNADIDTRSDSYSTALRSACYMSNYDTCKYLLEHKANVNQPNLMGGTPLINSIQSLNLVKLLIEFNVDINYQDFTGTTALHYAIQEFQHATATAEGGAASASSTNSLDVIKLLIQSGANPRLRNMYNEDAYRLASMKGDKHVLLYLIENTQPSIDVIVENLRLIGSFCMDFNENVNNALLLWQRAIRLQSVSTTSATASSHNEMLNAEDERFYANINDKYVVGLRANNDQNQNDQNLCKYSCLIRAQILGKYHRESIYPLMKRGAHYADALNYKLSIEYWNYALDLTINYKRDERQLEFNRTLSEMVLLNEYEFYFNESLFIINSLVSLYIEIYKNMNNEESNSNGFVKIEHLFKLYKAIETQIVDLADYVHDRPINFTYAKNYHELLRHFLTCINLILNFDFQMVSLVERNNVFDAIRKFIRQYADKLRSPHKLNSTLLHLCFRKSTTNSSLIVNSTNFTELSIRLDMQSKYAFPNLGLMKFLLNLNCGFHLNMKNSEEETPLFVLLKKYAKTVDLYSTVFDEVTKMRLKKFEFELTHECISFALNNGAHIDLHDAKGTLLSSLLSENEFYVNPLKYVKLSCLCANAIKKYQIKFDTHDLPIELFNFINIH